MIVIDSLGDLNAFEGMDDETKKEIARKIKQAQYEEHFRRCVTELNTHFNNLIKAAPDEKKTGIIIGRGFSFGTNPDTGIEDQIIFIQVSDRKKFLPKDMLVQFDENFKIIDSMPVEHLDSDCDCDFCNARRKKPKEDYLLRFIPNLFTTFYLYFLLAVCVIYLHSEFT